MPPRTKGRFWRLCRIYFRRFRMVVWLMILALIGGVAYLNQVGLPDFIKNPLLQKLRARGLELQFARLRWHWDRGLVAEHVRFGAADDAFSPQLALAEAQVLLNHRALSRAQIQIDGLSLRHGKLTWPIEETNRPARLMALENIETDLRLLPNDQWALDNFRASLAGGNIHLTGMVTNASAVRDWKWLQGGPQPAPAGTLQNRLRRIADTLERIEFSSPPDLKLDIRGDAQDLQSFSLRVMLNAPGSKTPWGTFTKGRFTARLFPTTNQVLRAEIHLDAAAAETRWATTTNLHLLAHLTSSAAQNDLVKGSLNLTAGEVQSEWASLTNARFTAAWLHALTNPIPISGEGQLDCAEAQTQWGTAKDLTLAIRMLDPNTTLPTPSPPPATRHPPPSPLWSWWTNVEPHLLDFDCHMGELRAPKLAVDQLTCSGSWRAPQLSINVRQANLYDGEMAVRAELDLGTRALDINMASDCDPHQIPLLSDWTRRWLDQFSWTNPPELAAQISMILPSWTNQRPDWRAEVLPTLWLEGQFKMDDGGAYLGIPVCDARAHFAYSNMTWWVPDLVATRPEGGLQIVHVADERTKDFYWGVQSTIDVRTVRPILEPPQQRDLDLVSFTQPPLIDAQVWGRWHVHERTGLKAQITLSNFSFRGEHADRFQTGLEYTNKLLLLTGPHAEIRTQQVSAAGLLVDFTAPRIFVTNGFSTADPHIVARAIGPHVDAAIEPYRFDRPPSVRVEGIIPVKDEEDADLHFDVVGGGAFHWLKFSPSTIAGHLHWKGQTLEIKDVRADFYSGTASGSAKFDFHKATNSKPVEAALLPLPLEGGEGRGEGGAIPQRSTTPALQTSLLASSGPEFKFYLTVTNVQWSDLIADLIDKTNKLEGLLSGSLLVNRANGTDWATWDGVGNADLRDGLIWDIPVFGVFSPVLNMIAPGLGNSRASAASGNFIITNGLIRSDDLEFHCSGMRLDYRGSVDFRGQVNARVDAEPLRDISIVGPVISTVLWPVTRFFEYKVTGSLSNPKAEPVWFIPKIMLMPFHPLRTLKQLFPEEAPSTNTFAPPPTLPVPTPK